MTISSPKGTAAAVIHQLRAYRAAALAIEAGIGKKVDFTEAELRQLHLQLSLLKDDIAAEYKRCHGVRSGSQLTEFESNYLCPAVSDLHIHFNAKRGSHPHSGQWINSLSDVVNYADYWLTPLEAQYPNI